VPLDEIRRILDDPEFDPVAALAAIAGCCSSGPNGWRASSRPSIAPS